MRNWEKLPDKNYIDVGYFGSYNGRFIRIYHNRNLVEVYEYYENVTAEEQKVATFTDLQKAVEYMESLA